MTSLISESGELIKDAKIIQMNYVSNWYCLDLLSCLPYDIIYFILDGLKPDDESENDSNASATSLFSALKGIFDDPFYAWLLQAFWISCVMLSEHFKISFEKNCLLELQKVFSSPHWQNTIKLI